MSLEALFTTAKVWIVEGISLASLGIAGLALILIELWGLKKIWKLIMR
jgi:hypothetical protein